MEPVGRNELYSQYGPNEQAKALLAKDSPIGEVDIDRQEGMNVVSGRWSFSGLIEEMGKIVGLYNPNYPIGRTPLETLPKDIVSGILGPKLGLKNVAALSQVGKTTHALTQPFLTSEWAKRRTKITVGPEQWKQVGVQAAEVPNLPDNIDAILQSPCPYFEGKRVYQTSRLILMPAGLSINSQGSLMAHLREGNFKDVFRNIWDRITLKLGDKEIEKPYWILVTADVIPGSRNKHFGEQQALLKEGDRVTSTLEAIVLATMCSNGDRYLLPRDPYTLARCEDIDGLLVVVGAFDRSGLFVDYSSFDNYYDYVGALAVRKFC